MVTWGIIITTLTVVAMLASMVAAPPARLPIEGEGNRQPTQAVSGEIAHEDGLKKAA